MSPRGCVINEFECMSLQIFFILSSSLIASRLLLSFVCLSPEQLHLTWITVVMDVSRSKMLFLSLLNTRKV